MSVESATTFTVDAEGVDEAAALIFDLLQNEGYDRRTCLRLRLALDGILLDWMEHGLEGAACTLTVEKRFGRRSVTLKAAGHLGVADSGAAAPDAHEGEGAGFCAAIVSNLGLEWDVSTQDGRVCAALTLPRKQLHPLAANGGAVVLAVVAGLALRFAPGGVGEACMSIAVTPLFDAFVGLLSALVGPMVFFSVVVAVVGAGDLKSLKGMGKVTLARIAGGNFASVCVAFVVAALFFGIPVGVGGAGGSSAADVVKVVLGVVPSNVVQPFLDGNILQIVCLAFGTGVGLLVLRNRLPRLAELAMECDLLVQEVLSAVMRFLPGFIFLAVVGLVGSMDASMMVSLVAVLACVACVMAALAAGITLAAAFTAKQSPLHIMRTAAPGAVIGFSTSSSAAAYTVVQDEMRKGFGISATYAKFAQPIVTAFYQPGSVSLFMVLVFFAASVSQVELTLSSLAVAVVMCFLLGMTAPPVPGGMVMLYGVVLAQTGLGQESLALFMAANVIFDALVTGAETYMRPIHVLRNAVRLEEVSAR